MITLQQDGKKLAKIDLVKGVLKVDYIDKPAADAVLTEARFINDRKLTDEEMYQTMPARYHGRILAAPTHKVDKAIYQRLMDEGDKAYLSTPENKAILARLDAEDAAKKKAR